MQHLSSHFRTYTFSGDHGPVMMVEPGEVFSVQTEDARTGTIRTNDDLLERPHPDGINPVTGPVFVRGAEPGDSLIVRIRHIEVGRQGFTAVKKKTGLLGQRAERFSTRVMRVENGWVHFSDRLRFVIRPMIGTIGVAPGGPPVPTALPGPHGGNMDNNEIRAGCTLHLPVFVPGALLSLGDVHGSMGDGEISMVGFDVASVVTLQCDIQRSESIRRPWIEAEDGSWITTGDDPDVARALRIASEEMVDLLMVRYSLTFEEAYMLATVRADLGICQCCEPGTVPATTRMTFAPLHVASRPAAVRQSA